MKYANAIVTWLWETITKSPASAFRWEEGVTPLSSWQQVASTAVIYLVVVLGGQYLWKNQQRFSPKPLIFLHNAFLSLFSGLLFVALLEELVPIIYQHGFFWAVCDAKAYSQRLQLLYYLNYLTKYYELVDTIFLVFAKKKLEFLHVYHHAFTMVLCYVELNGYASVQWVPIVLNLLVHVVMYYYYAISLFIKNIWWKKYLTTMQIVQFVIDIFVIYFCTWNLLVDYHQLPLPYYGHCHGTPLSAYFGCGIISSYLLLFIKFFIDTYKKKGSKKTSTPAATAISPIKQRITRSKTRDSPAPSRVAATVANVVENDEAPATPRRRGRPRKTEAN